MEKAAHSFNRIFSLLCLLVVSHFGLEGRNLVLTASVLSHLLPVTSNYMKNNSHLF